MSRSSGNESGGGGAGGASGSGGSGSPAQQANDMTRNMILGLPKEGLDPHSSEAADLRAAEAFVSDIQQEIMAYDIANAKAMETYMRSWWSKVPVLGRRAKEALAQEKASEAAEAAAMARAKEGGGLDSGVTGPGSALDGLDAASAAAAASAAGGTYMHTQSQKLKGGAKVERTSALSEERLRELSQHGKAGGAPAKPPQMNTWLFKRNHPGWVPLMQRWWVPWVCIVCIAVVWTPDVWKMRTLYYLDHQYALLRQKIHITYWKLTMKPDEFDELMRSVRTGKPTSVKGTDCPF